MACYNVHKVHTVMGQLLYSGQRAPRFVLGVPNVTDHLSRVNVPTAYYQMWHYTWGDSDIISSCHYLCQLFSCETSSEKCLLLLHHFLSKTVITSSQSNLTTGRTAAAHGRFNGIHQVAACIHHYLIHASFVPPESKSQTTSRYVQSLFCRAQY